MSTGLNLPPHLVAPTAPIRVPTAKKQQQQQQKPKKITRSSFGPSVWVAFVWLGLVIALAAFGEVIGLPSYDRTVGTPNQPPSLDFGLMLGTDNIGRSVLSRLVVGARVSIIVGLVAATIGLALGSLLGLCAAYFRGRVEAIIAVLTDTVLAFPPLIMLMAIAAVMSQSLFSLTASLGLLAVPGYIRLTKANAMQALGQEYITAARAMGARTGRIVFREVFPNAVIPLIAYSVLVVAVLMVAEGSLSFLGLGIPAPFPSWGGMIAAGRTTMTIAPHLVVAPAVALFLTVFALNTAGDGFRRRFATR